MDERCRKSGAIASRRRRGRFVSPTPALRRCISSRRSKRPASKSVLCLFEGVATGAADGWYRMRDQPAATLLHLGPGLANGLANIHNARRASSGMVNVVGEHALTHLKYDAPLTSDIEGLARPLSHWVRRIDNACAVAGDVAAGIAKANGQPGADSDVDPSPATRRGKTPANRHAPRRPRGRCVPPIRRGSRRWRRCCARASRRC